MRNQREIRNYIDFVIISMFWYTGHFSEKEKINQDLPKIHMNLKTVSSKQFKILDVNFCHTTVPKLSRNNNYVLWALLRIEKETYPIILLYLYNFFCVW